MGRLEAFIAAVETGSFSAASERLGTTPSAISKSVARLEQRLGSKLFRRSTRALSLTVEGTAYYERAAPLLRGLYDAEDAVRSATTGRRKLRITMPNELGRLLMNGLTDRFLPNHPEVQLDIGMTDRSVDIIREGYDLALRAGKLADSDLTVRTLGELPMTLVASPAYLERKGRPRSIEELSLATHVRYMRGGQPFPIRFMDGAMVSPQGHLDLDSGFALRIAALNGVGIAHLLRCTIEADIRSKQLEVVLPQRQLEHVPLHLLHAFGRTPPLRARPLMDFLTAEIATYIV
ncbi:LysR family transcriptional regulator [Bradyrhizobium sp. UFLA 03-164]|uniref:LysR family transcriptional regulator n=2 Tax=Bradyrhizobium uaiense TaxID=2594946 RepID=A0A6P1BNN0_9BRAD|nr:LysR family transcriptional regulator [Bradyrhizobium uaiense]